MKNRHEYLFMHFLLKLKIQQLNRSLAEDLNLSETTHFNISTTLLEFLPMS